MSNIETREITSSDEFVIEITDPVQTVISITAAEQNSVNTVYTAISTDGLINKLLDGSGLNSFKVENTLEVIENARQQWEKNEMASSHARLYRILTTCYEFYLAMKSARTSKADRHEILKGLDSFISSRGLKTLAGTHDMNRVVKAVFGEDRRRVSAYASALRVALTSGAVAINGDTFPVAPADLPAWISTNGGVEEIRKSGAKKGVSTKERVETAQAALQETPLMVFKPEASVLRFDANDTDKMFVCIVTYRPSGELEINSLVRQVAALNAALTAHYAENKPAMALVATAEKSTPKSALSIALGNNI